MIIRLIGWTLVHSLWQAALLAMALAFLLFSTRRASPRLRHLMSVGALLAAAVLPLATGIASARTQLRRDAVVTASGPTTQTIEAAAFVPSASNLLEPVAGQQTIRVQVRQSVLGVRQMLMLRVEPALPFAVAIWLIGVLLLSVRSIGGLLWAHRLTRVDTKPVTAAIGGITSRLADQLRVRGMVRVLESGRARVPLVIGWLRPVILLPSSLMVGLTPQQLEAILAHELAHIRRHDYALNLLQTVIETLLFYHPAIWWISGRIREEREHACDDLAVATTGGDRFFYSSVLVEVERWRGTWPSPAMAVTGGSLWRRVERLIGGKSAPLDLGARWFAGVITVITAGFSLGGAARAETRLDSSALMQGISVQELPGAQPDTVIRIVGNAPLGQRWQQAMQQARGRRSYYIGYVLPGDARRRESFYFDDSVAVRTEDGYLTGRLRFEDGAHGLTFTGVPLARLLGPLARHQIAIFYRFDGGRLTRVHLGNYDFPVHFQRTPLFWLGAASDAESVARVLELERAAGSEDMRQTLTAVTGVHTDAATVLPPLRRWLEDEARSNMLRAEAAEWLGSVARPEALTALSRRARIDRQRPIRHASVSALAHFPLSPATDTLFDFVRSLDDKATVRESITALGHRPEPRVVTFLNALARDHAVVENRLAAIGALANLPDGIGVPATATFAEEDPDLVIRKAAIVALGHTQGPARALETLERIARRNDPLREDAVNAMGHFADARAVQSLLELAEADSSLRMQLAAVDALGEVHPHEAALAALERVARDHPRREVRLKALEGLGSYWEGEEAARILLDLITSASDPVFQVAAVKALENFHEFPVFERVAALARGQLSVAVRRQAIETYGLTAQRERSLSFLESIASADPNIDLRLHAVQLLSDLDDDAGLPALRRLARSEQPRVRELAVRLVERRR